MKSEKNASKSTSAKKSGTTKKRQKRMSAPVSNLRLENSLWIVNLLSKHPQGLTLVEVNERYRAYIDNKYGWDPEERARHRDDFERRTFRNYLDGIFKMLHVYIDCFPKEGFRYKIVDREENRMAQWLMSTFAVNEALIRSREIQDRILLEEVPGGEAYLKDITDAMQNNRKITFEYQRFDEGAKHTVVQADPYCLKIYQRRWYVLVKEYRTLLVSHEKVEEMHVYSLDRIQSLRIEEETFSLDKKFNAAEYFRYAFGTRVEKDNPPQRVKLKVAAAQVPYLRTLPLHPSQQEIEVHEDYSIFSLHVALTVELSMQIMYYADLIEVLEPEELVMAIRRRVTNMAIDYEIIAPPTEEELAAWREEMLNDPELADKKYSRGVYMGTL